MLGRIGFARRRHDRGRSGSARSAPHRHRRQDGRERHGGHRPAGQAEPDHGAVHAPSVLPVVSEPAWGSPSSAPRPENPNSPANNPAYIKSLTTCAAKSNILQALKAAQSAQDNLTPAQIKKENKDYLRWRKCMIAPGLGDTAAHAQLQGSALLVRGDAERAAGTSSRRPGQNLLSSSDLQPAQPRRNRAARSGRNASGGLHGVAQPEDHRRRGRRWSCSPARSASPTAVSGEWRPSNERGGHLQHRCSAAQLQNTVALNGTLARKQIRNVTAATQGIVSDVYSTNGTVDQRRVTRCSPSTAERRSPRTGPSPFFRSLVPGDQGDDVVQLKQILAAAGDYPGPARTTSTPSRRSSRWPSGRPSTTIPTRPRPPRSR